ncbi:YheC/YheD family protein [Paenibacillus sp. MZ04-78.2]|uniref:YheC/YheD family protein n=1 Tax=Paenibacillus sp. MZ04-78.2 TaxID=2962034 RepID=UPI0020B84E94|nr:YheC/YheD family protein [Paenibacillus sp. MZ04-78.2]MCP3773854.1 YheC/YheD family protein [Paenibacillus sp. MZ04-78.2]
MRKSKPNNSSYIVSKWAKTQAVIPNRKLAKYIPETRKLNRESLRGMLDRHGMVYVKPNSGTYGIGVIRVERLAGGGSASYRCHTGTKINTFAQYDDLYRHIAGLTRKRMYLVQKGIHLLKYKKRRFDLRVMVQKTPTGNWLTTGLIGRVAAPGKVVTNVHNGGKLKPVEVLLQGHAGSAEKSRLTSGLRRLGTSVAGQLRSKYRRLKEIGLDVALDEKLHPWILEINTAPDPYIFRKLKDKRIFARIYRYAKAYGRL